MLFMIHYEITPEHRDAVHQRFLQWGDAEPKGVKVIGNWFSVTQLEGWNVVEATDSAELANLFHAWTDLNVNHITPVLSEEAMRAQLKSYEK